MNLTTVTQPASEPVSLDEAKLHLRVSIDDEDALISSLIVAARQLCEKETRRALVPRTYKLTLDCFPQNRYSNIILPKPPLSSVESIEYLDSTGTLVTLDSDLYTVQIGDVLPGIICPVNNWPSVLKYVVITFQAGYSEVPEVAKQAMLLLIGSWFRNREAISEGSFNEIPLGVKSLLSVLNFGSYQ